MIDMIAPIVVGVKWCGDDGRLLALTDSLVRFRDEGFDR
jgi:hypothetical protein